MDYGYSAGDGTILPMINYNGNTFSSPLRKEPCDNPKQHTFIDIVSNFRTTAIQHVVAFPHLSAWGFTIL